MADPTQAALRNEVSTRLYDVGATTFVTGDLDTWLDRAAMDVALRTGITGDDIGFIHTKNAPTIVIDEQIARINHLSWRGIYRIQPFGKDRLLGEPWRATGIFKSYPVAYTIKGRELWLYPAPSTTPTAPAMNDPGGISATDTSVILASVTDFPGAGRVKIESEWIYYGELDTTNKTLKALRRGIGGTTAASHADALPVALADINGVILRRPKKMSASQGLELGDRAVEAVCLYVIGRGLLSEGRAREAAAHLQLYKQEIEMLGALDENLDGMDRLMESDWPGSWYTIPNFPV